VGSVLYSGAAMADGRSARLRLGVSILAEDGKISWIRPAEDEGGRPAGCEYVDAGGTTIVPGLVDGHSHLTLPGGSHWIDRASDPTEVLLAVAEANGEIQHRSGVRWARDVGSPRRVDGGRERALSLGIRDRRGGELLGEPDAGVIAEGGPADFSLVHGDPLTDPTALWRVWRVA
jgi:imidazolonepropionase-like amidohydrolase